MSGKIRISILLSLVMLCLSTAWAQDATNRQRADAEMEKARELLKQGYFDSAVVKYQDAFKIAPNYTVPYEELGKLMMEKRNFAYAIQMYGKLAEIQPTNPDYHKVLFNLYDAYDAPNEALQSGEVLVKLGEAEAETLKKMAELYGKVDRPLDKARTMGLYAEATNANADYYNDIAGLYLEQNKPFQAEDAINVALEKDPGNAKYRNTLGRIYSSQNKVDKAEEVFAKLSAESPNDQGLKDELAQIYAQQGDSYLTNGRANTALEYYDLAEATGKSGDSESSQSTSIYRGTVNTANQVFQSADGTSGTGIGNYRRGASGFSSLGGSINDRRESAKLLLRPQYQLDADFGNQDINSYTLLDNVFRVPIKGTELDLRVRHSWRDVSSGLTGSASREFIYGGFNYNWDKNWSTQAYVGSRGLFDVTTLFEGDKFRGGLLLQRDIWAYTPRALGNELFFNRQSLFGGVSLGERWSVDGNVDLYQFNDDIDQTIFSIGPSYQLIFDPGVQELSASYIYSGQSNSRTIDPQVRFSPRNLTAHSIGLDYNRVINDKWRLRAGYFHTWTNQRNGGSDSGGTWNIGSDFQLWKGAWLGLNYQRGNFGQGAIGPNLGSIEDRNDNLNVSFGTSF